MRVLLNTVPLYGKGDGVRTYTAAFLRALSASNADMEWVISLRPVDMDQLGIAQDPRFRRLSFAGPAAPPNVPGARFVWRNVIDQAIMPFHGRGYDVLHFLDTYGPLLSPPTTPLAITVHDLLPITDGDSFPPWVRRYLAFLMSRAIPRASAIMAISQATAHALTTTLGVPAERITVTYNGVDASFYPVAVAERAHVARQYGIEGPYLIAVGAIQPRKNLPRVIQAFARAKSEWNLPHHLVIAGRPGWGYRDVTAAIAGTGLGAAIHLLGYAPSIDLPALISGADAAIYLSLAEGFGLPVAEAMACGTPVVTSTVSALAEVAGAAAYLVDPTDEVAISEALGDVCRDTALRERLRQAGLARARLYSWSHVANEAIRIYRALGVRRADQHVAGASGGVASADGYDTSAS